jgi:hypothetical protein
VVAGLLAGTLGTLRAAHAGDFSVLGLDGNYSLQANYALAVRLKNPADGIINAPADPLLALPDTLKFSQSINYDDGDRNFKSGSLINNRLSLLGELNVTKGDYGAQLRADTFADSVYLGSNDNDARGTVNKQGSPTDFTSDAHRFDGRRVRLLDAYAFGTWYFGEQGSLNVRAGRHVVAWGDSLFFSGIALAQAPSDATKANVPGADVKSIVLPVDQLSMQLSLTSRIALLAQYKLEFKPNELDPVGTYFSVSDAVGPGAQYLWSLKAALPGFPSVNGSSIIPHTGTETPSDFGQYGAGIKVLLGSNTSIGLYRLRYDSTIPLAQENFGSVSVSGLGTLTVPLTYSEVYADGIDMTAASFSTRLFGVSVAGEAIYRQKSPVLVNYYTPLTSNIPTPTRSNVAQGLLNAIYNRGPGWLWDSISVAAEVGYVNLTHVDPVNPVPGGSGAAAGMDQLTYSRTSVAGTVLVQVGEAAVFNGWDLNIPVSYSATAVGQPSLLGAFGSLQGAGDERASLGATFTYQQDFDVGVIYSAYFGSPNFMAHPYADRDNIGFNVACRF